MLSVNEGSHFHQTIYVNKGMNKKIFFVESGWGGGGGGGEGGRIPRGLEGPILPVG